MLPITSASCCNKVLHISCHFNDHEIRALNKYKVSLLADYIYQALTKWNTELLPTWRIPLEPDDLQTQWTRLRGINRIAGLNSTLFWGGYMSTSLWQNFQIYSLLVPYKRYIFFYFHFSFFFFFCRWETKTSARPKHCAKLPFLFFLFFFLVWAFIPRIDPNPF